MEYNQNLETDCSLAGYIKGLKPMLGQKGDVIITLNSNYFYRFFIFF